jgi:hypothetical protein
MLRHKLGAFVIVLAIASFAAAQAAETTCPHGGKIELEIGQEDWSTVVFTYRLSNPSLFSVAWIEVWDQRNRLSRKKVPVEKLGQIAWAPKEGLPETPSWLLIGIGPGVTGEISYALIGGMREEGGEPSPVLSPGQSFFIDEGADSGELTISGDVFSPVNSLLLIEQESSGIWIAREYLSGVLADLQHATVQIPVGYLARPTVLKLEPAPLGSFAIGSEVAPEWRSVTVYVKSKDQPDVGRATDIQPEVLEPSRGPTIRSVSPYPVPLMDGDSPIFVELKIYGEGFRKDQYVVLSNGEVAGVKLETEYISSQELHAQLPRELWRNHQLSARLVAQTATGSCSTEVREDE